ncbi:hypothetical protein Nmel_008435 [Mimus melanotis]
MRLLCLRAQAVTPNPPHRSPTPQPGLTQPHEARRAPAHGAGGSGALPVDWAGSARRRDISDQRGGIRGSGGRRRLRRVQRWELSVVLLGTSRWLR